ncbi:MAG: ABC transporter permease subunit [Lentisphaeria bacterium]|nr:ABC transporter permease [Lentisphaeria bacterium]NQZ70151.1 ABC transporter permease subunit [Lentisphaeria bacterium]
MSLFISLLMKEFLYRPRQKWFHMKRVIFVVICAIIVVVLYGMEISAQSGQAGLSLFENLSMISILASCLISPYVSGQMIVKEKDQRTLGLLLMSDISLFNLCFSKWASSFLSTCITMLSVVPLFILCISLGGISFQQIFTAFIVLMGNIMLGSSLGMLIACLVKSEADLQRVIVIYVILFFAGLFGIAMIMNFIPMTKDAALSISSIYSMNELKHGNPEFYQWITGNLLLNVVLSIALIPLTVFLLPYLYFKPATKSFLERLSWFLGKRGKVRSRASKKGNPVIWKDLNIHYGGESNNWLMALLSCFGLASLVCLICLFCVAYTKIQISPAQFVFYSMGAVTLYTGIQYVYGNVTRSSNTLSRERDNRTLDIMMTTQISGYDIIMGKSMAINLTLLPWIVCFIISSISSLVASLVVYSNIQLCIILLAVILNMFCMVFAYQFLALYYSMKIKDNVLSSLLVGFIAWYFVGNLCFFFLATLLSLFTFMLSFLVVPLAGPMILGNHFRLKVIEEFYELCENLAYSDSENADH